MKDISVYIKYKSPNIINNSPLCLFCLKPFPFIYLIPTYIPKTEKARATIESKKKGAIVDMFTPDSSLKRVKKDTKQRVAKSIRIENISKNLSTLITELEDQGYDIQDLKEDTAKLNEYIKDFSYEYSLYVNELREAQDYVCGNSEGEYRNSVQNARGYLLQARETSLDIRCWLMIQMQKKRFLLL